MPDIPPSILKFFESYGREITYARGEILLHAHTKSENVYLISDGVVKAYSVDKTGTVHVHALFGPGKCLPLMRVVNDTTNHLMCAAHTPVTVKRVSKEQFLVEIDVNPTFTKDLLQQSLAQFALFTDRIENLEYSSARERLLYRLLSLAGALGEAEGDELRVITGLSHDDLAQSIQVSREVVSRLMGGLKQSGVLSYSRGELHFQPSRVLEELRDPSLQLDYFNL